MAREAIKINNSNEYRGAKKSRQQQQQQQPSQLTFGIVRSVINQDC